MPLTVRLDPTLEHALERYCTGTGVSKSLVVQESLAAYLIDKTPAAGGSDARPRGKSLSANFRAFADAGFIGAAELGGVSADKAAVRERLTQRITQRLSRSQTRKP